MATIVSFRPSNILAPNKPCNKDTDIHTEKNELAFINSNSLDKPDPNARQLIRSHVMRSKNKRKRASDGPGLISWINQRSNQHPQETSLSVCRTDSSPSPQIGSALPLTHFAYEMPPYALDLIFKFFTVLGEAMYPIELCLMFNVQHSVWVEYLAVDALYCHSVLWITQTYFDWLRGGKISRIQIHYAHETLVLLRQRLNDSLLATSDVTIGVVVGLVMMAAFVGDLDAAEKHMMGLYKMVELRGGVRAFGKNSQMQIKICRADLTLALYKEQKPIFFPEGISWEPYIIKPGATPPFLLLANADKKLSNLWGDLKEFTRSANIAFQTGQKMDCVLFQEILVSVQYRLLLLDVDTGSLNEAFYLGMLAFSTNIFLQMQGLEMGFEKLSVKLKDAIFKLSMPGDLSMLEFKLWLLFVAHIFSISGDRDEWIIPEIKIVLKSLNLNSWKVARGRLKDYLWIDTLHDKGGRKAFQDSEADVLTSAIVGIEK